MKKIVRLARQKQTRLTLVANHDLGIGGEEALRLAEQVLQREAFLAEDHGWDPPKYGRWRFFRWWAGDQYGWSGVKVDDSEIIKVSGNWLADWMPEPAPANANG